MPVGRDDDEVAPAPGHCRGQTNTLEPDELVGDGARVVVLRAERGDRVLAVLGYDDVCDDKAPARAKARANAPKEPGLFLPAEVMDDQGGDDEVDKALGQRVLDPADAQVDPLTVEQSARYSEHLVARVDSDELCPWMVRQQPASGLASASPEFEDCARLDRPRRLGGLLLETVEVGDLGAHALEVPLRIPVELIAHTRSLPARRLGGPRWRERAFAAPKTPDNS